MNQLKHMAKYFAAGMLLSVIVFFMEARLFYKANSIDLVNAMGHVGLFFIIQSIFLAIVLSTIVHVAKGMKDVLIEKNSLTRNEKIGLIALLAVVVMSIALPMINHRIFYYFATLSSVIGLIFIFFGSHLYKDVRKSFSRSFLLFGILVLICYNVLLGFTVGG